VVPAIAYDDGSFLFCHGATNFQKKAACISRRFCYTYHYTFMERENAWDLETILAGRLRYRVLVIFMDLFLCQRRHSDSDGNTPMPLYIPSILILGGFFKKKKFLRCFVSGGGLVYGARRQSIAFLERENKNILTYKYFVSRVNTYWE
jgi:hypothetical protein